MAELPGAAVKRLLTKHGNELRTSSSAVGLAVGAAEEYIARLAQEASQLAQKERRKTIMDSDIQRAKETLGHRQHRHRFLRRRAPAQPGLD